MRHPAQPCPRERNGAHADVAANAQDRRRGADDAGLVWCLSQHPRGDRPRAAGQKLNRLTGESQMMTWPTRATLRDFVTHPQVRFMAQGIAQMVVLTVAGMALMAVVPPLVQMVVASYLVCLVLSIGVWLICPAVRLWLTLLLVTTGWALGMLALTLWSLMACVG